MNEQTMEFEQMKRSFYDYKSQNKDLRYCILENPDEKKYIIFYSEDNFKPLLNRPFSYGEIVAIMLNHDLRSSTENLHHVHYREYFEKNDISNVEELFSIDSLCKDGVEQLVDIINNINTFQYDDKTALKCSCVREWKKYRYILFPKLWGYIANSNSENETNELMGYLQNSFSKNFIPYDIVYFVFQNQWVHGKVWFSTSPENIFQQDLYHVLVDRTAGTPRICPRCGTLFYSNNNKSKYCNLCKAQSNIINNENRKKSPRYMHKRIYDKINLGKKYTKRDLNDFLNESNLIWDIVRGKNPDIPEEKQHLYENIKTVEDYKEWLKNKFDSL